MAAEPFGGTGALAGSTTGVSAPNMQGDLLYNSRSVSYGFIRVNGITDFAGLASTTISNASVAENNSPTPLDRLYFRFNYFDHAQAVTGLSNSTLQVVPPNPGAPQGIFFQLPQTKFYDTKMYTFGGEKTFLDGLASVEVRVPVSTTLASKNLISVADLGSPIPGSLDGAGNQNFNATTTPQNTLGHEDTEFGNMSLFLKGILYESRCSGLLFSGGLGVGIPTGEDTRTTVVDVSSTGGSAAVSGIREKDVLIANETWALTPFLAALWVPNERCFAQGFLSAEIPLNASRISFTDTQLLGRFGVSPTDFANGNIVPSGVPNLGFSGVSRTPVPPTGTVTRYIREQPLVHLDLGAGYWVYRDHAASCLTGIAPNLEVHYTGSFDAARVVTLPGDATSKILNPNNPIASAQGDPNFPLVADIGPIVGGQHKTINIVDLTVGTTFEFGKALTLAPAFTVPLTGTRNRTFDWEAQLQLNWYFAAR
jgi:hypothetical protein